ncbi:zinc ribbon domain-containing protein [Catenulispora pinisilvae]|uniref:zinc ribbon domain-containing protein n=1 Tax=Catenulispora pinisilvae TaxID=2705253 RepID=UPI001891D1C1|nr:zinc ribbon domain-containing protein [Catenulispora pinisilvae]
MAETDTLWFSNNHRDYSNQSGNDAGFEFEFYCQRCNDTWRSGFEPYRAARAAGWIRRAANMAHGATSSIGWDVANGVDGLVESGWHKARDASFKEAIVSAETHFNRCGRCSSYVCARCYSPERGLCTNCAPDLAAEVESARTHGLVDAATMRARDVGATMAAEVDVTTQKQLVCLACGHETHGAKFCPECGAKQSPEDRACGGCGSKVPAGSKFCPECGDSQ